MHRAKLAPSTTPSFKEQANRPDPEADDPYEGSERNAQPSGERRNDQKHSQEHGQHGEEDDEAPVHAGNDRRSLRAVDLHLAKVSRLMSTVKIPPVLRPSTGGEREVAAEGDNVGDVLRSLATQHPDTQRQLFGEDGSLNRYVNVYLNDEDVRVLEGLDTAVSERDTLVILPAMAGG